MAPVVPEPKVKPVIGRQLFDIITSGMYDNPLMIYREYIQNAVDSIDLAAEDGSLSLEEARISVTLRGQDRSIVIEDNGKGLPNDTAHGILTNLGCSPKEGTSQRGFRGIGRLGGLAYCDELIFETRSVGNELVSIVRWNRKEFDAIAADSQRRITLQEMIQAVASLDYQDATEKTPPHFFRVTLKNVHRFHSDMLMNVKAVNDYLAQSVPVPYNRDTFSFAEEIEPQLAEVNDYRCYHIQLNNRQVFRPYCDEIKLALNSSDGIADIDFIRFKGVQGETIAVGWYAKTSFLATLPSVLNVKGIRVRQGNIEVGGEHFLDDKYSETRFSGWQIGEIHVVNGALKPNARRDGFEHTPAYEKFLEQSHLLGRHLSSLCRKCSNTRIANSRVQVSLVQLERLFETPLTFIDEEHHRKTSDEARAALQNIEKMSMVGISEELASRLDLLRVKIASHKHRPTLLEDVLDKRRLKKLDSQRLLKHIAKTIMANYSTSTSPEEILQQILVDFTKPNYSNHKLSAS
jgi:molecular chaperone HtpG